MKDIVGNVEISINKNSEPDKRSYKVNFDKYKKLSGNYYPNVSLHEAVEDLEANLKKINFNISDFRNSFFMRLKILDSHIKNKNLNNNLEWLK